MKRVLPFALLALALPTVAFATTIYSAGDFVSGTFPGYVAPSADLILTASLASMTLEAGALYRTPSPHVELGSDAQALLLLIPGPPAGNFANDMPLGMAKVTAGIPEPGTLGLLGVGLIGLASIVRWKLRGTNTFVQRGIRALRDEAQDATRASVVLETAARAASDVKDGALPRTAGTHRGEEITCASQ